MWVMVQVGYLHQVGLYPTPLELSIRSMVAGVVYRLALRARADDDLTDSNGLFALSLMCQLLTC